jgi:nucleotide-binding universal stress UspA family protein
VGVVVVGYVARPEGRAALQSALAEAQRRGSRLVVVNSARGPADAQVADDVAGMVRGGGVDWELVQLEDRFDAAEDLLAAAEEHRADLIVVGLRRRKPVGKLILGSNVERVLLDARCPVLAVQAEEPGYAR